MRFFGVITGHNLRQAKLKIAEFCRAVEEEQGRVNIDNIHSVTFRIQNYC